MGHPDTQIGEGKSQFPPTAWTLLAQLRNPGDPAFKAHLEHLIGQYWRPVYKYVRMAWKRSNEDAKDLTQSFFSELLDGDLFSRADPEKGNFRRLLLSSLKNYLINVDRGAKAVKRGGDRKLVPLDGDLGAPESTSSQDPAQEFDQQWAREILERSIERLKGVIRAPAYAAFQQFHLESVPVKEIAARLAIPETQVAHHLQAARSSLRALVMEEIRQYVTDEQEIVQELDSLFQGWR